jgi:hypothetical protein
MKKNFQKTKAFHKASTMPAGLRHWPDKSQPFELFKSEVISWLISQPEILSYLFSKLHNSGAIQFDPNTETWHGALNDDYAI